ncbi:MAG: hypothetical protein IH624_07215 [Phycisphaerae bacterium]|nr:hypothetical protein [Phycisphaerae bacterium]
MTRPPSTKSLITLFLLCMATAGQATLFGDGFFLSCEAENDLYRVLKLNDIQCSRYDTAAQAIEKAPAGSPVLILADKYPATPTRIEASMLSRARQKDLRLYVEYPASLPGLEGGQPKRTHWERAVITSDRFGGALEPMRIVAVQDCHYVPFPADKPWMVIATVAGFDTAVFGLPKSAQPLLFEFDAGVLVATTKLSQFVTGRYAPLDAWPIIWGKILEWLTDGKTVADLQFEPSVHASYARDEQMPADHERQAVIRGVDWYRNARLLIHDEWKHQWDEAAKWHDRVAPAPQQAWPVGDGSCGMLEGFSSRILCDGNQYVRWYKRADCNCESAMAFAFRSLMDGDESSRDIAANLLDYVYFASNLQQGPRANPESPSYGLVGWDNRPEGAVIYYGDDNARAFLGTMGVAGALKSDRWDESLLRGILGNFRTAGRKGFRGDNHHDGSLQATGWQRHFASGRVEYAPHFESWLWATYLWLYHKTGYEPLLERARTGIALTMKAYPDQWRWTNGIQQERARMILPLAWLVRVDDTPEHRQWLRFMAGELLDKQDASGAIREEIGAGHSYFPPPQSNEDYGRHEASLLQKNGDPVCDLLYTTNFAFFALHEAAAATGDPYYRTAGDKLADFLCRIQVKSPTRPEFDGAWFRAFEYERWDYWASNADVGWGVWATETGWTQGWISGVMALRQKDTSLWDLTADSRIARHFDTYRKRMIPDEVWEKLTPKKIEHAAAGCTVQLSVNPAPQYAAFGAASLTDGMTAFADHTSGDWLGFEGLNLEAVIDLEKPVPLNSLAVRFLQSVPVGIFLPRQVEFAVSDDGEHYRVMATVKHEVDLKEAGPLIRSIGVPNLNTQARYIRVKASNIGPIPDWHQAAGKKAWMFVDEVMVNAPPEPPMPAKPHIVKLGTIDVDLVETTPVVFKHRLYRFEYVRQRYWANKTGDSYFRFVDHATGRPTAPFAKGFHLGSAFVDNDTVYVTCVPEWDASTIHMFVSTDLKNWRPHKILDRPGFGIFNTSVCKADDEYVLLYEIGRPAELAGHAFTALFARSKDMLSWEPLAPEYNYSKDRYTAPHCLRYLDGWFYNFYLEAHNGWEMRVVRSRDLTNWQSSPLNPVLRASEDDKRIANPALDAEQRQHIASAQNINNSDIDFCAYKDKVVINYSWGNQSGREFLAEAVYSGSLEEFLLGWYP